MSNRTRYSIVKGILPDQVRGVIAETVQAFPGPRPHSSHWSDWQQVVRLKEMTAAIYDGGLVVIDDAWWLADKICRRVDSPYLELRRRKATTGISRSIIEVKSSRISALALRISIPM